MIAVPAAALGVFGALIGSFLNVVVYRVPLKLSVVSPPSACPHCGARIRGYDNIPVVSWLVLRARCRDCGAPISARYPLVEAGTGLVFAGVAVWFLLTRWSSFDVDASPRRLVAALIELVAFLYLGAIGVALALIDRDTHTLPNRIVVPGYVVGVVLLGASAVLRGDPGALLRAAIGGAALFLFYFVVAVAAPRGMGFGDVKLAGVLGLFLGYLGWAQLVVGAFAAFLLGGLFAVGLLLARRAGRRSGIPFGPWMIAGAWLGIVVGAPLAKAYLRTTGVVG